MKIMLVYVLYFFIIGSCNLANNKYQRQLDSGIDIFHLESADTDEYNKRNRDTLVSIYDSVAPIQQNRKIKRSDNIQPQRPPDNHQKIQTSGSFATPRSSLNPKTLRTPINDEKIQTSGSFATPRPLINPKTLKTPINDEKIRASGSFATLRPSINPKTLKTPINNEKIRTSGSFATLRPSINPKTLKTPINDEKIKTSGSFATLRPSINPKTLKTPINNEKIPTSGSFATLRPSMNPKTLRTPINDEKIRASGSFATLRPSINPKTLKTPINNEKIPTSGSFATLRPSMNPKTLRTPINDEKIRASGSFATPRPSINPKTLKSPINEEKIQTSDNAATLRPKINTQTLKTPVNEQMIQNSGNTATLKPFANNRRQRREFNYDVKNVQQKNISNNGILNHWSTDDITQLVNIFEKKINAEKKKTDTRIKDVHIANESNEDFEYQLSQFLGFQKTEQQSSEEVTSSSKEKSVIYVEIGLENLPTDKNRMKRELASNSRYILNVRPEEDIDEGESTSTMINNLESIDSKEIESFIAAEPIDEEESIPIEYTNNNDTDTTFLARLTSFLFSFYATIRDIATNIYSIFANMFK